MTDASIHRRRSPSSLAHLVLVLMTLGFALGWYATTPAVQADEGAADAEREAAEDADADAALIKRNSRVKAKRLNLNQTDEILAIIRDVHPELAARIADVQQRSPDQLKKRIKPHLEWVDSLYRLKQLDPRLYELRANSLRLKRAEEQAVLELRAAYKTGKKDRIDAARESLRSVVTSQFDVQQALRDRELERLQARLKQLVDQADRDKANRQKLIDDRVIELDPIRKP